MKIAVLDDTQDAVRHLQCFALLKDHEVKLFTSSASGVGQLALRLAPFDALVLIRERTRLTRVLLRKLPRLKLIAQTGKVGAHIDLEACRELGITVLEGVGDPTAAAELTWALIMAASRKLPQYVDHLRKGLWQTVSLDPALNTLGVRLKGRKLGIWGYGKIGQLVAAYGRAFGMQVLIWGSAASRDQAIAHGYLAAQTQQELFAQSDVLTLHLRLNDATRHCVRAADLAAMKPDALLVNTSRAELIDHTALMQALEAGRYAALDVFDTEPLPDHSPLLRMPNVVLTPHIGYVERYSYEQYFEAAFRNVVEFAAQQDSHSA